MYRKDKPIYILPMTVIHENFKQKSREMCRGKLGLPLKKKLIGFNGSICNSRGIDTLFKAVHEIQLSKPEVKLVLTGRVGKNIKIPDSVIHLDYLSDDDMHVYINSMDVLAVINKNTKFGNYSYPVKLYEAMACKLPVVVSKTKSTEWIMSKYPELLVEPEDYIALAEKIKEIIDLNRINYDELPTWNEIASRLSDKILTANSNAKDLNNI